MSFHETGEERMLRNTSSAAKPLREGGSRRALEAELGHTLRGAGNRLGIITADCTFLWQGKAWPVAVTCCGWARGG